MDPTYAACMCKPVTAVASGWQQEGSQCVIVWVVYIQKGTSSDRTRQYKTRESNDPKVSEKLKISLPLVS
jgi:hypothetical protein